MYIRKIVSVVYDDSGSMKEGNGEKWAYANYAMQAFCGMLNSEDQLYITYMSDVEDNPKLVPPKIDLTANGIQNSVNNIRSRTKKGSTPWAAVETAYNKLLQAKDNNPNTQYWLVVITDGDFDVFDKQKMNDVQKQQFLDLEFSKFAQTAMPNGTHMQITYLAIGKSIFAPQANADLGITPYRAQTASEITGRMAQMADKVSGRNRLTGNELKKIDDKTVQVSSAAVPLLNIAVIANSSDIKVLDAYKINEKEEKTDPISIARQALLNYPNFNDLNGSAFLLGDSNKAIGSGTYRILFDKPVDWSKVAILYEPALEVRMNVSLNGNEVKNFNDLVNAKSRDKVKISCKLYEMNTDKEISPSLLPSGTTYHLAILENHQPVKESTGSEMALEEHELQHVPTTLKGEVSIPGFSPITYVVEFTPVEYIEYGISSEYKNDVQSVKFNDIGANTDLQLLFRFTANGTPVTDPEAVKKLGATITAKPDGNTGTVEYAEDGALVFTPNATSMSSADKEAVPVEVTCALPDGTSATATYTVEQVEYGITAEYANNVQSVKYDEIGTNKDLQIVFRFTADGEAITDSETVKTLGATITAKPDGNTGTTEYTEDGALVYTPNATGLSATAANDLEVEVTCAIAEGTSATAKYTVLKENYGIGATGVGGQAPKHTLYENKVGVAFAISTESGRQLSKTEVENGIEISLDEVHKDFLTEHLVGDDGVITVVPRNPHQYKMNPWSWLWYWKYYFFDIPDEDITVTLNHPFGTASGVVDVVGAPIGFMILNVWLPIVLELFLLLLLANYIYCVLKKPRFAKGAKLYVGRLRYDAVNGTHIIRDFTCINLERFNKIKRGNGRLKFKLEADVVRAGGIRIRADYSGCILCEEYFPWYRGCIEPYDYDYAHLNTPARIQEYFTGARNRRLEIEEFAPTETIEDDGKRTLRTAGQHRPKFFVVSDGGLTEVNHHNVIQNGRIFIYTNV
ncbi:MAG: hypothetical protein IJC88_04795 [Oscillospiraceae bacterium]|nr:hypothetical protein [Oscillospiraceae bacterium]